MNIGHLAAAILLLMFLVLTVLSDEKSASVTAGDLHNIELLKKFSEVKYEYEKEEAQRKAQEEVK